MKNNFDKAITFTLQWEGGYVNHPNDPGGETKYGISKRSYPDVDIKSLTVQEAKIIYKRDYWDEMDLDEVEFPLDICMFDTGVLCGRSRAYSWKQALGQDLTNWRKFLEYRMVFHLSRPKKLRAFVKGWINRVNDLKKFIEIISQESS